MKKTRLLVYFLAAAACALSIPACGGGGEDGGTYISLRQFAGGAKAFKVFGVPSMRVFVTNSSESKSMTKAQADDILNGTGYGPGSPDTQLSPEGEYEGKLNLIGAIQFDDGTRALSDLSYGTYGGETGVGVLEILPQQGFEQSNSDQTRNMIHFLGGVSAADVTTGTGGSGTITVVGDSYSRYLLFSLAGCWYRVVIDFASGTMDFFLNFSAEWDASVVDSSGNVIPGVVVTHHDVIDALKLRMNFIAVSG